MCTHNRKPTPNNIGCSALNHTWKIHMTTFQSQSLFLRKHHYNMQWLMRKGYVLCHNKACFKQNLHIQEITHMNTTFLRWPPCDHYFLRWPLWALLFLDDHYEHYFLRWPMWALLFIDDPYEHYSLDMTPMSTTFWIWPLWALLFGYDPCERYFMFHDSLSYLRWVMTWLGMSIVTSQWVMILLFVYIMTSQSDNA